MEKRNTNENKIEMLVNKSHVEKKDIKHIWVDAVKPYAAHPFKLYHEEKLDELVESIKEHGILNPVIVRVVDNGYELLSGHNRWSATMILGMDKIPAIVKTGLTDAEAYVYVIETNLMQRSFADLLPSEQAAVLAARYDKKIRWYQWNYIVQEIAKLEGIELGLDSDYLDDGQRNDRKKTLAKKFGISSASVGRLLRINKLIPEFRNRVDGGSVNMRAAVELSYCTEKEQKIVYELVKEKKIKLDPKTAKMIKEKSGELLADGIVKLVEKNTKTK